jgi:hypothetical protein
LKTIIKKQRKDNNRNKQNKVDVSDWAYLSLVSDDSVEQILKDYSLAQLIELQRKILFLKGII